jgi:hypothetical protein
MFGRKVKKTASGKWQRFGNKSDSWKGKLEAAGVQKHDRRWNGGEKGLVNDGYVAKQLGR